MPIDYKKYPVNWKSEIVPAVLERAENKCECCGLYNKQTVYGVFFWLKDDDGKYKRRSMWFSDMADAIRESGSNVKEGLVNAPYVRQIKVVLTIAHLDHDETNHDVSLDRLKAMCQQCHLRYDAKEKYRRLKEKWAINKK